MEGLIWRSCSGVGREPSDSYSLIEQSVRSLSLKVGGLECVLFLFRGWAGVEVTRKLWERRGRGDRKTGIEGRAADWV